MLRSAYSKLLSNHIISNILCSNGPDKKQVKPAQWEELNKKKKKTAVTWDNTTTNTVLVYEDMHQHWQTQQTCAAYCVHFTFESFCIQWCSLGWDSRLRGCIKKYWYDERSKCLLGSRGFRFPAFKPKSVGDRVPGTSQDTLNKGLGGQRLPASLLWGMRNLSRGKGHLFGAVSVLS